MAKKLDENKMLLILLCKDKAESDRQVEIITKIGPIIPQDFECTIHSIIGKKNFAASFNDIQKKSDAKYKIYITSPVSYLDKSVLMKTLEAFYLAPKTGMVGMMGTEIPVDGNYVQAKNFYGLYNYLDETGKAQQYLGKDPLMYQSVHIVEKSFFATNEDLTWDERVGDEFALAAQCCNFRAKGADVGVFYQEKSLLTFEKDEFAYNPKTDLIGYNKQLERFRTFYVKKFQPLVSILIPTYNQPKFCQEALESALNQTYQNIEILVGDDSTNEDTKNMIRPYLKRHSNLKYFYHDGKIPRGGGANMAFLLNTCSGEFVNYLLHDDLFHPEKIAKMMQYYVTDFENRIGLVTSARSLIDENDKYLARKNPWQPRSDTIVKGEDVGRMLLFIIANFIGELTTALFRKTDVLLKKHLFDEKKLFAVNQFCGVRSVSYGDMDTWMEILKSGKDMVFMSESLSAFRRHAAQNTYNPNTRIALPLDALNFITTAWLNDTFLRNEDEFRYCLNKWPIMADRWFVPIKDDDNEITKKRKEWLIKLKEVFVSGEYLKMTDAAISYLLYSTNNEKNILSLTRRNVFTGLLEKNTFSHFETKQIDECGNLWKIFGRHSLKENNNKFGTAFNFDGETWLALDKNFKFGGSDFAVAGWAYLPDCTLNGTIFCLASSYNHRYDFSVANISGAKFRHALLLDGGNVWEVTASCTEDEKFFHFELDYKQSSRTLFLFINGQKIYENVVEPMATPQIMTALKIGSHYTSGLFNLVGRIEEFIFTEKLLHDEEFTPPDKPYEKDKFTKILLHFGKKNSNS